MPRREEVLAQMVGSLRASDPEWDISPGSPEWKILEAVAQEIELVSYNGTLNDYHFDIDSKSGLELELFLALFGYARLLGRRATGSATFGMENTAVQDYIIRSGTQIKTNTSPPIFFQTTTTAVLAQGSTSVIVPIEAVVAGTAGNVAANSLNLYTTPIGALTFVNNDLATSGGRDAESDSSLRARWRATVFRNISGTEDRFLATAYNETAFVSRANVIGPVERFNEQTQLLPPYDRSIATPWETELSQVVAEGDTQIHVVDAKVFPIPTEEAPLWLGLYDGTGIASEKFKLLMVVRVIDIDFDNNILYLDTPVPPLPCNNDDPEPSSTLSEKQAITLSPSGNDTYAIGDEIQSLHFLGSFNNNSSKSTFTLTMPPSSSPFDFTTEPIEYGRPGPVGQQGNGSRNDQPGSPGDAGFKEEKDFAIRIRNALGGKIAAKLNALNGTSLTASEVVFVYYYRGDADQDRFYIHFKGPMGKQRWDHLTFNASNMHGGNAPKIKINEPVTPGGSDKEYFTHSHGGQVNTSYLLTYNGNSTLPANQTWKITFRENLGSITGDSTSTSVAMAGDLTAAQVQAKLFDIIGTRESIRVTGGGLNGKGFPYTITFVDVNSGWKGLLYAAGDLAASLDVNGQDFNGTIGTPLPPFTTTNTVNNANIKVDVVAAGVVDFNEESDYNVIFTDDTPTVAVTNTDIAWDDDNLINNLETTLVPATIASGRIAPYDAIFGVDGIVSNQSPTIEHKLRFIDDMQGIDFIPMDVTQDTIVLKYGIPFIKENKTTIVTLNSYGTGCSFKLKIGTDGPTGLFTFDSGVLQFNGASNFTGAGAIVRGLAEIGHDVLVQPLYGETDITLGFIITYVGRRLGTPNRQQLDPALAPGAVMAQSVTGPGFSIVLDAAKSAAVHPYGPTGGTLKLAYDGEETSALDLDMGGGNPTARASYLQTALDTLSTTGTVTVTDISAAPTSTVVLGNYVIRIEPNSPPLDITTRLTVTDYSPTGPATLNKIIYLSPLLQYRVDELQKGQTIGGGDECILLSGSGVRELWLTYSDDNQYVYEKGGEIVSYFSATALTVLVEKGDHTQDYVYYSGNPVGSIPISYATSGPNAVEEDEIGFFPALFITPQGSKKTGVDAVITHEYEYTPWSSRNDPRPDAENCSITNKVDIFVDGSDNQQVLENIPFPKDSDTSFFFQMGVGLGVDSREYIREDGITMPFTGNYFVPLGKNPIALPPESITALDNEDPSESQTYYLNQDYWFVEDLTDYYGSPRSINGLEWVKVIDLNVEDFPDNAITEKVGKKPKGHMETGWYAYAYNIIEDGVVSHLSNVKTVHLTQDKKKATNKAKITFAAQALLPGAITFARNLYRTKKCTSEAQALAQAAAGALFFIKAIGSHEAMSVTDILNDSHLSGTNNGSSPVTPPKPQPSTETPLAITYSYNKLIERLDAQNNTIRVIGQDVLTHSATILYLKFNLAIVAIPGYQLEAVRADLIANIGAFLRVKRFTGDVQLADIIHVAEQSTGVDNVRFALPDEALNDVQRLSIWQNTSKTLLAPGTTDDQSEDGLFSLTLGGYTTGTFEYDANDVTAMRLALEQLPNIEPGVNFALPLAYGINDSTTSIIIDTIGIFNAEAISARWFGAGIDNRDNHDSSLYIQIEDEIMHVYNMTFPSASSIEFSVVRGALGSVRSIHEGTVDDPLPIDVLGDVAVAWHKPWSFDVDGNPIPADAGAVTNPYVYDISFLINGVTGINNWGTRFIDPITTNNNSGVSSSIVKIVNGTGYGIEEYARNKRTLVRVHTTDFYFRANELPVLFDVNVVFRGRNSF